MYRYINVNLNSNPNSQNVRKKPQKSTPISLLSGGNSFFVKVKSNQIATNYIDKNNNIKQNNVHKVNNTYFSKENKDKSLKKNINNTQTKNYLNYNKNNSINYRKIKNINNSNNNNKSLNNKSKQESFTHNKGLYSFTSGISNEKVYHKNINSSSILNNYNEAFLTINDRFKINISKMPTIREKSKETKKIIKEKNDKVNKNNNIYNHTINESKTINLKNRVKNKISIDFVSKQKNLPEKNIILTNPSKYTYNNQMKLSRKNQITNKNNNNKNVIISKNISNNYFNSNFSIEKIKFRNNDKNNNSEGKNRLISQVPKRNNKLMNMNHSNIESNNYKNLLKENIKKVDQFNNVISNKKIEKKIKTVNININNECLNSKSENNNITLDSYSTFNDKSLLLQKKNMVKNNINKHQHVSTKSNNIISKNTKLDNLIQENKFNLNPDLNNQNDNRKDSQCRNIIKISNLNSINIDNNKKNRNNYSYVIKTNNYLYNYFPFVTLNNSENGENVDKFPLNSNSLIENHYHINTSQNLFTDKLLYYNTIVDNKKQKDNKTKMNKINKNEKNKLKIKLIETNDQNNYHINDAINFHTKIMSSNTLDNNINRSKTNRYNLNLYSSNNNNIFNNYVSKEKNKKKKQNPPLNKNSKKLNILSLIQENNRKIKDNNIRTKSNFPHFPYNNKSHNCKNDNETIENILYQTNDKLNNSFEMFDNFDDMNTIIKRINFEDIDVKKNNIFTVENKYTGKNVENNYWYDKFSESFNQIFDKKFLSNKQNMSAAQNKINKAYYIHNSRQSGSTKASNKENSSIKKLKVYSYIGKKLDKSGISNIE